MLCEGFREGYEVVPRRVWTRLLSFGESHIRSQKGTPKPKIARTAPKNFLNNSRALPNKTGFLRQIAAESSPESSAKSLSHEFFRVLFLSLIKCRFSKCRFGAELKNPGKYSKQRAALDKQTQKNLAPVFSLPCCAGIDAALVRRKNDAQLRRRSRRDGTTSATTKVACAKVAFDAHQ